MADAVQHINEIVARAQPFRPAAFESPIALEGRNLGFKNLLNVERAARRGSQRSRMGKTLSGRSRSTRRGEGMAACGSRTPAVIPA